MSQHQKLTHALRNLAQHRPDDMELIMRAVKALETPPCMPRLDDGMVMIPCALVMDPISPANGWLHVPHVDMHWLPLIKLSQSSGHSLETWLDETKEPTWAKTLEQLV